MSIREICRRLHLSRIAIRSILAVQGAMPVSVRKDKIQIEPELLTRLFAECNGRLQRVHEKRVEEEHVEVTYPTLTRRVRELGLGRSPDKRCGREPDVPGAEMQHDTTTYALPLAGVLVRLVASCLYFRFSKVRYLKFYRAFNRFAMKCFLHEALTFWRFAASLCVIDNTNLARLRGTGAQAVMVPEMEAFGKGYGFKFLCHEVNHANRKAGEERSFWTVETNFLPGRRFQSLEDLNAQALQWATVRFHHRPVSKTRLIPAKAFEHEQAHLTPVPPQLPGPYLAHERETDQYGYVCLDGNFYWVPGTSRDRLTVLQYGDRLRLCRGRDALAEYPLPADGVKNRRFSPEGLPAPRHHPHNRRKPTEQEEKRLRDMAEVVGAYLDFALKPKGIERHRFVRELFALQQEMTAGLFLRTVERALKYGIGKLPVLRRMALLDLQHGAERLPFADVDAGLRERAAYVEGRLTDPPDFSVYEALLEKPHGSGTGPDAEVPAPGGALGALGRVPGPGPEGTLLSGPPASACPGGGGQTQAGERPGTEACAGPDS
jgi:hypothetical protein